MAVIPYIPCFLNVDLRYCKQFGLYSVFNLIHLEHVEKKKNT